MPNPTAHAGDESVSGQEPPSRFQQDQALTLFQRSGLLSPHRTSGSDQ